MAVSKDSALKQVNTLLERKEFKGLEKAVEDLLPLFDLVDEEEAIALGEKLFSFGYVDLAWQLWEKRSINSDEARLWMAKLAIHQEEYDLARSYLYGVTDHSQSLKAQKLFLEGKAYAAEGDSYMADFKWQQAQAILPDNGVKTSMDKSLDQVEEALSFEQFETAEEILGAINATNLADDDSNRYHLYQAYCLAHQGEFEAAIRELKEIPKEAYTIDLTRYQADLLFQLGKTKEALQVLNQVEAEPEILLDRAFYENKMGDSVKAEASLLAILDQDPMNAEAVEELGRFYQEWGLAAKSLALYQNTLANDEMTEAPIWLGDYLNLLSNLEDHTEIIQTIEAYHLEGKAEFAWLLAHAYNEEGDYAQAKTAYELACEHYQEEPQFLEEYALFLRDDGDWESLSDICDLAKARGLSSDIWDRLEEGEGDRDTR